MNKKLMCTFLALLVMLMPTTAASANGTFQTNYQVISSVETTIGGLVRTVEIVQADPNPIDKFEVVRVRHPDPSVRRGSILLAPGLGTGFQLYEVSDTPYYRNSFAGFLATRGFDVWGFSQRLQGLTAGTCESGAADCSVVADWGLAQLAADAEYVRTRIVAENPGKRPVIGGQSMGAMISFAAINENPEAYRAAIILDGDLYSEDPVYQGMAVAGCLFSQGLIDAGIYYEGGMVPFFKLVNMLADVEPNGSSPVMPGLTNLQAWVMMLSVPIPGPTTPTPTYVFDTGDWMSGTLTYANPDMVHDMLYGFIDYLPWAILRDGNCSIAGLDGGQFISNLAAFDGPVFAIANGHGFDTMVGDTISLMPDADVTLFHYPDFGHMDHMFATNHFEILEQPLLQWLATDAFAP